MEVTDLLRRASAGDAAALNDVLPFVYDELRRLASAHLRQEQAPMTLQATALVHEALLRLTKTPGPEYENRSHFFGIAARVMRHVLVDQARARNAAKRGGGRNIPLADLGDFGAPPDAELLLLNDALDRLSAAHPFKGQLIELRFFGGFTVEEISASVGKPDYTVRRELRLAQAWLRRELSPK